MESASCTIIGGAGFGEVTDLDIVGLGVGTDASPERIKAAYREMLKDWHPDRFAGDAERPKSDMSKRLAEALSPQGPAPEAPAGDGRTSCAPPKKAR